MASADFGGERDPKPVPQEEDAAGGDAGGPPEGEGPVGSAVEAGNRAVEAERAAKEAERAEDERRMAAEAALSETASARPEIFAGIREAGDGAAAGLEVAARIGADGRALSRWVSDAVADAILHMDRGEGDAAGPVALALADWFGKESTERGVHLVEAMEDVVADAAEQDALGPNGMEEVLERALARVDANTFGERGGASAELADAAGLDSDAAEGLVESGMTDSQWNPVNRDGTLKVEVVGSVAEITDADFTAPTRNVQLPQIPSNVDAAIGANGRPVVIKRNIFEKNHSNHPDLSPEDGREILERSLYSTTLVGQSQPITHPNYMVAIKTGNKNSVAILDITQQKDSVEVVGWRKINVNGLERMKKQADWEGGHFLILHSPVREQPVALSDRPIDSVQNISPDDEHSSAKDVGRGEG